MGEEQAKSQSEKTTEQHAVRHRGRQQRGPQGAANRTQTQSQQRLNPSLGNAGPHLRFN
jgi:hypothetical protein